MAMTRKSNDRKHHRKRLRASRDQQDPAKMPLHHNTPCSCRPRSDRLSARRRQRHGRRADSSSPLPQTLSPVTRRLVSMRPMYTTDICGTACLHASARREPAQAAAKVSVLYPRAHRSSFAAYNLPAGEEPAGDTGRHPIFRK